jgi:hypothetical protein
MGATGAVSACCTVATHGDNRHVDAAGSVDHSGPSAAVRRGWRQSVSDLLACECSESECVHAGCIVSCWCVRAAAAVPRGGGYAAATVGGKSERSHLFVCSSATVTSHRSPLQPHTTAHVTG